MCVRLFAVCCLLAGVCRMLVNVCLLSVVRPLQVDCCCSLFVVCLLFGCCVVGCQLVVVGCVMC